MRPQRAAIRFRRAFRSFVNLTLQLRSYFHRVIHGFSPNSAIICIRLYAWPHRLWDFRKQYQWNGLSGGGGVGYNLPASLGAALANKKHGRFTVAFGGDGDFMYNPGTLWTAAHHKIPILYIVHNNRAYHQEYMYLTAMAVRHGRGVDRMDIGTTLIEPNIDYATVARGMGVQGEGPITDPNDLGPALARAIAVVKSGEPAVVDVVTDPR